MDHRCPTCGAPVGADGGCPSPRCARAGAGPQPADTEAPDAALVFARDTVLPAPRATPPGPPAHEAAVDPAAVRVPGYEVLRVIGAGGMGVVLEARQLSLGRKAAVKVLPRELAGRPGFAARFEREAEAMARLTHPNIVAIYDRGRDGDLLYFTMEYVEPRPGEPADLRQAIDRGRLDPEAVRAAAVQVARALGYAHRQGVVHRDVKPSNVMLDRHGAAKVADFGIATLLAPGAGRGDLTAAGSAMGTFGYMAPEQQRDAAASDHRADVFSLGVMVYEMLTGELPVGAYAPPSRLVPGLPAAWDEVVARAMRPKPDQRFPDMEAFAAAVEAAGRAPAAGAAPPAPAAVACPGCGAAGGEDDRFCGGCGLPLLAACPGCRAEVRAGARYCPACRLDLESHRRKEQHRELARRLLAGAAAPGAADADRAAGARRAVAELAAAAALDPSDRAVRDEADAARRAAAGILEAAADRACAARNLGLAAEHCHHLLDLDPTLGRPARRLEEIGKLRANSLAKARRHWVAGRGQEAVAALAALAKAFPGDPEIGAEFAQVRGNQVLVAGAARTAPALQAERRFHQLAGLLRRVRETGAGPPWLGPAEDLAAGSLRRADEHVRAARAAVKIGRHELAAAEARRALAVVADHPDAAAALDEAEEALAAVNDGLGAVRDAVEAGRWFRARVLLRGLHAAGLDPRLAKAEGREADRGVARAADGLRVVTLTLFGAGWVVAAAGLAEVAVLGVAGDGGPLAAGFGRWAGRAAVYVPAVVFGLLAAAWALTRSFPRGAAVWGVAATAAAAPAAFLAFAAGADGAGVWEWLTPNDWKAAAGVLLMTAAAAAAAGGVIGAAFADVVRRAVGGGVPEGTVEAAGLAGAAGMVLAVFSAGGPPGAAAAAVPAWAAAGLLAAVGLATGPSRYGWLLAAAVGGAVVARGTGTLGPDAGAAGAWAGRLLVVAAAVLSSRPFGPIRSPAAAAAAGGVLLVYQGLAPDSPVGWAVMLWLGAAGTVAAAADRLDFRPQLLDRLHAAFHGEPVFPATPASPTTAAPDPVRAAALKLAWVGLAAAAGVAATGAFLAGWVSRGTAGGVVGLALLAAGPSVVGLLLSSLGAGSRLALAAVAAGLGFAALLGGGLVGTPDPVTPPAGWDRVAPPGAGFSAVLPAGWGPAGAPYAPGPAADWAAWAGEDRAVGLKCTVLAGPLAEPARAEFRSCVRASVTKGGVKVVAARRVRVGGTEGVELEGESLDRNPVVVRAFAAGDRGYLLVAETGPKAAGAALGRRLFLGSFRTDDPAAGPTARAAAGGGVFSPLARTTPTE